MQRLFYGAITQGGKKEPMTVFSKFNDAIREFLVHGHPASGMQFPNTALYSAGRLAPILSCRPCKP